MSLRSSETPRVRCDRSLVLPDGPAVDLAERERSELRGVLQGPAVVLTEADPVVLGDLQGLVGLGSGEGTAVGHDLLAGQRAGAEGLEDGDRLEQGRLRLSRKAWKLIVADVDDRARYELIRVEVGYFLRVGPDAFLSVGLVS